jgi:hypothetical protein
MKKQIRKQIEERADCLIKDHSFSSTSMFIHGEFPDEDYKVVLHVLIVWYMVKLKSDREALSNRERNEEIDAALDRGDFNFLKNRVALDKELSSMTSMDLAKAEESLQIYLED